MANNIEKLLACLIAPCQDLEDALQQLKLERFVDTADGEQLDVIGRIAGQRRLGLDDDTYRRYIRARVATHNSDGTTEDLLTICDLIVYDDLATYVLTQEGIATARLSVIDIMLTSALGTILFGFLNVARSTGVRIILNWWESDPADMFRFDAGPGFDDGHLASSLG